MFALAVNKILQATPPKFSRETGMCAIVIYVRVHTAAAVRVLVVLYDIRVLAVRTPVSSLSFQVQQYLEHGTCKHPTDYKSEVWRSVSRVKNSL